jgi:uncharacterized protein YjiS (DUF1127 family)
MLPGSLEAGRRAWLAPPSAKLARFAVYLHAIRRRPHVVWLWLMRVQSRRDMAMLSDHMLRDIGLTRGDVERELMKPFWRE